MNIEIVIIFLLAILCVGVVVGWSTDRMERKSAMEQLDWLQQERRRLIGLVHWYRVRCPEAAVEETAGVVTFDERRLNR